jgi:hypothetical protein
VLYPVIIVSECRSRVVRRIDEDALHFASELLLQRLEREQVFSGSSSRMRGSSFGRFSLPIHVSSNFCFFVIYNPLPIRSLGQICEFNAHG